MRRSTTPGKSPWLAAVVLAAVFLGAKYWPELNPLPGDDASATDGAAVVEAAFAAQRSDVWVTLRGEVQRVLRDDNDGSRHQRFIVELPSGHTVLVAHNIDLAPRVAGILRGQPIELRGEYEYNPRGGVIHWTHHDPSGRRDGGWIRYQGKTYR